MLAKGLVLSQSPPSFALWLHRFVRVHGATSAEDGLWKLIKALMLGSVMLMLGIGWMVYGLNQSLNRHSESSAKLHEYLAHINHFERLIVDMESAQRGWLIERENAYLEPYERAKEHLPAVVSIIESFNQQDPASAALFTSIRTMANARQMVLESVFGESRQSSDGGFPDGFTLEAGKRLMDKLRDEIELLRERTKARQALVDGEIDAVRNQRNLVLGVLLVFAVAGLLACLWLMARFAEMLQFANEQHHLAEAATSASREKSAFLANMSHEIRTPMNAIFGFAQLLGDMVKDAREQFYAKAIIQSGQVLLDLINDILDLSKVEAGRLELSPESVSLSDLTSNCETLFRTMATEKGLSLHFRISDTCPDAVEADPLRVRQILINLLANALKYTPSGAVSLLIDARFVPDQSKTCVLIIKVSDTGMGIPADKLTRIFEPFVQVKHSTSGGSGLGLSIVHRLVTLMGGSISVESEEGKGSCFTVTLPDLPIASAAVRQERVRRPISLLPPLKILAVDDVDLNRRLIEGYFANTAHTVRVAHDGQSGIDLALQFVPDLILMDIRMPGMDGITALRELRTHPSMAQCRIVAATASSLRSEEDRSRHLFDGYLRKPLTREDLEDELFRLFGALPTEAPQADGIPQPLSPEESAAYRQLAGPLGAAIEAATATLSSDAVRELIELLDQLPNTDGFSRLRALKAHISEAAAVFDINGMEQKLRQLRALFDSY